MLDDVLLAELEVVVGRDVLLELLQGLSAQVAAVDQEQHAPGAGELDQAVAEDDGGEGLAGAGGHLDESARPVLAQRLLESRDRLRFGRPEIVDERRHLLDAGEEGAGSLAVIRGTIGGLQLRADIQPLGQSFGSVKAEHRSGAWLGVEAVGEAGFDAGRFVGERKRTVPRGQSIRQPFCVSLRLRLDTGERDAFFLRLDNTRGPSVYVEKIVGKTVARFQGKVSDRNAPIRQDVRVALIAHRPARLGEQAVDVFSGFIFGGRHFGYY